MNDYKELIEMLRSMSRAIIREDANALDMPEENIWDADANAINDAADAIEKLTKEYKELDELNDSVCSEYRKAKKERDTLLSLVNKLGKRYGPCDVCGADCPGALDRDYQRKQALVFYNGDCPKWEWRGVREDNDEID